MKRYLLALICLNCLVSLVYAQEETRIEEKDTLSSLESEVGLIPESLDANVDSLLRTWHVQYFSKREDFCHDDDENVYFPDSVYIDRLSRLPSVIALPYNNIVRDCIDYAKRCDACQFHANFIHQPPEPLHLTMASWSFEA